jgi:hypothetical protein
MLALNCSAHKNDNNICETEIRTLLKFCNIRNNLLIISRNCVEQNNLRTDNEFSIDDNNFIIKSKKYQIKKNGNTSANDINIISKTSISQETLREIGQLKPTIILSANEVNSKYEDFVSKLRDFNISVMIQGNELSKINKNISNIDFIVNYEPHHNDHVLKLETYHMKHENTQTVKFLLENGNNVSDFSLETNVPYITPPKHTAALSTDEESQKKILTDTSPQVSEFNVIDEPLITTIELNTKSPEDTHSHVTENIIEKSPPTPVNEEFNSLSTNTIEESNNPSKKDISPDSHKLNRTPTAIKILIYIIIIIIIICIFWNMDIINNINELMTYFEVDNEMAAITNEISSDAIINDIPSDTEIPISTNAISDDQEIIIEDINTIKSHVVKEFVDHTSIDDLTEQVIEYIF